MRFFCGKQGRHLQFLANTCLAFPARRLATLGMTRHLVVALIDPAAPVERNIGLASESR